MQFSDFVAREAIITDLQATTKEGAIREIVHTVHSAGFLDEQNLEAIIGATLKREELGSTGVGRGVGFPEAYHPSVDHLIGCLALSRRGVEWDALDEEPVDIVFLLFCSARMSGGPGLYARAWETVARHLKDDHFADRLRQAETREEVIALLDETDRETP